MTREEALQNIKKAIGFSDTLDESIFTLFPELQESEDERIRKAILGLTYLDGIDPILTKCSVTRSDIRSYIEKQKEQKPAEWSKDDKFKLEDAITGIDVGIGFYETEGKHPNLLKAIIEAKEWLKSLHPQSHWKPSKEQLGYLSKAIATFAEEGDCKTVDVLNELRKDLNDNFVKI